MQSTQQFIGQYCDGDPATNDQNAIAEGRRELVTWDQVMTCATVLPELQNEAQAKIRDYLGYLPNPSAYMNHEVFIRALIDQYRKHEISKEKFDEEMNVHIRHIRNDDILQGGYIDNMGEYTLTDMERYRTHFVQYSEKAKDRLKHFTGYVPALQYSLYAQLMIRELCAMDGYVEEMIPTAVDYKAINLIQYLEVLHKYGKEQADDVPPITF